MQRKTNSVLLKMSGEAVGLWLAAGFCWAWEYAVIVWYASVHVLSKVTLALDFISLLFHGMVTGLGYVIINISNLLLFITTYILKTQIVQEIGIAYVTFTTAVANCTGWTELNGNQKANLVFWGFFTVVILMELSVLITFFIIGVLTMKKKRKQKQQ